LTLVRPSAVRADPMQPAADELAAWVQAVALHQDRQAFARLFKHFAPRVKSYLQRTGASEELAEEVVQETMVSLWRKAAMFDAGQAAVSTWVFTIARNLRIDALRRRGPVGAYEDEGVALDTLVDQAPLPEEQVRQARRDAGLHAAIGRLPAEQAQVLRLSFFEERPHAQIASELGIPLGTVKSRVRLAVAHIRRLLNHLE
jgi:RNA polymerase sigma-70 factor (ECF subfamily)